MRTFFGIIFLVLMAVSAALYLTLPGAQSPHPVLFWVTQDDSIKRETIRLFGEWLRERGLPHVEIRIDNANQGITKKLVQGVSGMGADLIDVYANEMELLQASGVLLDVTDLAEELEFGLALTYPAVFRDISVEGRQFGFPRNVSAELLWVNLDTFAHYGLPPPPPRWTFEEFEEAGLRFVAAANPPGTRSRVFFVNRISREMMRRSLGLSLFNETMTECVLDDPRNVEVLERLRHWTHDLRLIPTQEEERAFAADATGFDMQFSLFAMGRYAMVSVGRWALIRLRPRGNFQLAAVEPPHGGMPNTEIGAGFVGIYAGGSHIREAALFLQFLTSRRFNELIVRSGDSLPPLPAFAETDEFRYPPDFPNEWGAHEAFARAGRETGIAASRSPYVLPSMVNRIETEAFESVLAGRLSPSEAAVDAARRINQEIAITIRRDPALAKSYAQDRAYQQKIEDRISRGERIPAEWIRNPYHLVRYQYLGWLEESP